MLLLKVSYCIIDVLYILTAYILSAKSHINVKMYYFDTQVINQYVLGMVLSFRAGLLRRRYVNLRPKQYVQFEMVVGSCLKATLCRGKI